MAKIPCTGPERCSADTGRRRAPGGFSLGLETRKSAHRRQSLDSRASAPKERRAAARGSRRPESFVAGDASSALKYLVCKHPIMTETRMIGQRVIWAGISLAVMCLAYFHMLDRVLFTGTAFSPIFRFLLAPDLKAAWIGLAICCFAALWNRPAPIFRVVDFLSARAAWVAAASVVLFALGTVAVYRDYPLSMDEYSA